MRGTYTWVSKREGKVNEGMNENGLLKEGLK